MRLTLSISGGTKGLLLTYATNVTLTSYRVACNASGLPRKYTALACVCCCGRPGSTFSPQTVCSLCRVLCHNLSEV